MGGACGSGRGCRRPVHRPRRPPAGRAFSALLASIPARLGSDTSGPGWSPSRVPLLVSGPPRAPLSCRDWGGAALFPAAGTISGRPFPGGSHPLDSPGKRGPSPRVAVCGRGGWICVRSQRPPRPGTSEQARGHVSERGAPTPSTPLFSQAAALLLVGEGAGAGWRQGPGWGAGRRREAPGRIALSRNVLCPAPPWLRPKYWPLPWPLLGVTCASSGSRRLGQPAARSWVSPLICCCPSSGTFWGTVHLSYGRHSCQPGRPGGEGSLTPLPPSTRMGEFSEKKATCGTVCLKYLLFTFNCCFWLAGLAVMAVGIWTLALKSDYISLLASNTYLATAYILVVAGVVVMVTGLLGCCATFKERRNLLRPYFILLLIIFLLEIVAGILAYVYYQQLNAELKENLKDTMTKRYHQPGHEGVTSAVDKLQQEFHCCGSNNSQDWQDSEWIRSGEAGGRLVPDSCCKTVVARCGQRVHASNIYKVEGGCITKLETFIQEHLRIIGAVGLGIACVQVFGMIFTCCLYKSLKLEHY